MLEFFELATAVYEQSEKMPTAAAIKLAKAGDKVFRLLGIATG